MSTVIAGRFDTIEQAEAAMQALQSQNLSEDLMTTFYVGPPGQHDRHPMGGDEDADAKAEGAHGGSAAGAAVGAGVGLAALAAGPLGVAAAAGVGAYTGALVGALGSMKKDGEGDDYARQSGIMLAVNVDALDNDAPIIRILEQQGAQDIEKTEAEWADGEWIDFDPVARPHLIHPEARR